MSSPRRALATIVVNLMLTLSLDSEAQTQRSGGDAQRAVQQLQQIASERAAAQAEATKAKQAAADLTKQVAQLTAERDALKARVASTQAGRDAREHGLQDELDQTKVKLAELLKKFRETATTLRDVESSRTQAREELARSAKSEQSCAEHNVELANLAEAVLKRYSDSGGWHRVARSEPFTRLSQTRVENLADEYRARVQELKAPKPAAAPPATTEPEPSR